MALFHVSTDEIWDAIEGFVDLDGEIEDAADERSNVGLPAQHMRGARRASGRQNLHRAGGPALP